MIAVLTCWEKGFVKKTVWLANLFSTWINLFMLFCTCAFKLWLHELFSLHNMSLRLSSPFNYSGCSYMLCWWRFGYIGIFCSTICNALVSMPYGRKIRFQSRRFSSKHFCMVPSTYCVASKAASWISYMFGIYLQWYKIRDSLHV